MNVLVVVSHYHRRQGFPRFGAQIAVGLRRLGHSVTVLTQDVEARPEDADIAFESYRVPQRPMLLQMAVEPFVLGRLLRRAEARYDAVLVVGIPVLARVVLFGTGTHLGYVKRTRATLSWHSPRWWVEALRPFHRIVTFWERRMLQGSWPALVVVGSERYRADYLDLYGVPAERVMAIPLAVEQDEFVYDPSRRAEVRSAARVDDDTQVLLSVAGRGRQKGLDVLVRALEQLPRDEKWVCWFAGSGSTTAELERATAGLRQENRVRLLGSVDAVGALYSAADLLVFPSRFDPWGLAVTEALSTGLPVVASSRAGAAEAVVAGVNGALVEDPEDEEELSRLIAESMTRAWDRETIRKTIAAYSVDAMARRIERAIEAP